MADTIREKIIQAFQARAQSLSAITIERALRSDTEITDRFITIWDGQDQLIEQDYNGDTQQFPLALDIQWEISDINPSVSVNALIGEVRQLIESSDTTFGDLATQTKYDTATPQYPIDGSTINALTIIYIITYSTLSGDPYSVA